MSSRTFLLVLLVAVLALFAPAARAQTDDAKKTAGLLDKISGGAATKVLNATAKAVNATNSAAKAVGAPAVSVAGINAPSPAKSSAAAVAAGALAGAGALAVLLF